MRTLGKVVATIALCASSYVTQADFIESGELTSIYDNNGTKVGTTVDKWYFTVGSDSEVTFDVLSWEIDESGFFPIPVDLNMDTEFTFFDSFIYLFLDDGDLTEDDLIDMNDDSDDTFSDGSLASFDSFLVADLFAGDYILAIGAAEPNEGLDVLEAISGISDTVDAPYACEVDSFGDCIQVSSDVGDYQISFIGDVTLQAEVSAPWVAGLFGAGLLTLFVRRRV